MSKCVTEGCHKQVIRTGKGLCSACYDDLQMERVTALLECICIQLDSLPTKGMLGEIERSLDLAQGSLLNRPVKPELITLLRICTAFPWMIKVAANNYGPEIVKRSMMHAAVDAMIDTK